MKTVFNLVLSKTDTIIDHFSQFRTIYSGFYLFSAVYLILFPIGCAAYASKLAYDSMGVEAGSTLLFRWFFFFLTTVFLLLSPKKHQTKVKSVVQRQLRKHVRQPIYLYWSLMAFFIFILLFPILQFAFYGMTMVLDSLPFAVYLAVCTSIYSVVYYLLLKLYQNALARG